MIEIFQIPFMSKALIVSLVTSVLFSYTSVYVVLKRIVFVSIALSQLAALGLTIGHILHFDTTLTSLVLSVSGAVFFAFSKNEKKISNESFIGFVYAFALGLTIIFISKSAQAESQVLDLISGNILTIPYTQMYVTSTVFLTAGVILLLFSRQFISVFYDSDFAVSTGLNSRLWNLLFYLILAVTISIGMRASGILLTFSYLVVPALIGLVFASKLSRVFLIAVFCGAAASVFGLYVSFVFDLPSGPSIITLLSIMFIVSYITKRLLK